MQVNRYGWAVMLAGLTVSHLQADFTYEQTSKITGGAIVGMMKFAAAMSKDAKKALDAVPATTSIKGNRMVYKTADNASIIDIDKETITNVSYARKTYSVITFAQMKQAMDEMAQKMQKGSSGDTDMRFDMKLNDTGMTKNVNGNDAHQVIMTFQMQGTDAKSGAKGGIDMTSDMWVASKVSGYDEVRAFHRRMGQKLDWAPGSNPMINRPDMAKAIAEMYKEGAKLDGMPVMTTMKMGGNMEGMPDTSAQPQSAGSNNSTLPPTSVSGALGAALGGRFGGFGGRKKPQQDRPVESGGSAATSSSSASLLEMTTEITSYSSASADPSLFEIPSGYQQVQEDPMRPGRHAK